MDLTPKEHCFNPIFFLKGKKERKKEKKGHQEQLTRQNMRLKYHTLDLPPLFSPLRFLKYPPDIQGRFSY